MRDLKVLRLQEILPSGIGGNQYASEGHTPCDTFSKLEFLCLRNNGRIEGILVIWEQKEALVNRSTGAFPTSLAIKPI